MDSAVRGVHDLLVVEAAAQLRRAGCVVVLTETSTPQSLEAPDAMGWLYGGECLVIECKASRSDLLADRQKLARLNGAGMGAMRWYLTASDVVVDPEADLAPDWGWMLYTCGRVVEKRQPQRLPSNMVSERHHLISACRHLAAARAGLVTCRAYKWGNAGRASVGAEVSDVQADEQKAETPGDVLSQLTMV
jgi:hypothetical protein